MKILNYILKGFFLFMILYVFVERHSRCMAACVKTHNDSTNVYHNKDELKSLEAYCGRKILTIKAPMWPIDLRYFWKFLPGNKHF